jgi:hypothetical protein
LRVTEKVSHCVCVGSEREESIATGRLPGVGFAAVAEEATFLTGAVLQVKRFDRLRSL